MLSSLSIVLGALVRPPVSVIEQAVSTDQLKREYRQPNLTSQNRMSLIEVELEAD